MRFGGLQKFSLSDYPGKVAAIVFTQGCNFTCPFCHNSRLIPLKATRDSGELSEGDILNFLKSRIGQLQAVVITGGEPTIHRDLPEFIAIVRRMGFAIKLDTNGSNPQMLKRLLDEQLIDCIAMDIKAPWKYYQRLSGVAVDVERLQESVRLIEASAVKSIFRTTFVDALHGPKAEEQIRLQIPAEATYVRQQCNLDTVLDPFACHGQPATQYIN